MRSKATAMSGGVGEQLMGAHAEAAVTHALESCLRCAAEGEVGTVFSPPRVSCLMYDAVHTLAPVWLSFAVPMVGAVRCGVCSFPAPDRAAASHSPSGGVECATDGAAGAGVYRRCALAFHLCSLYM